jgi:Flp pilus assembly protein TadG
MVGVADLSGHFVSCTTGTAAVEAAIFAPIFLIMTLGVTDLGSGMFVRMSVNAATQAGAAYAVIKSSCTPTPPATTCTPVCASLSTACLGGIKAAMNEATGVSSFCTGSVCAASITGCADGSPKCIRVSVNYPFTPILPDVVYSWAQSETVSSTIHIRIL